MEDLLNAVNYNKYQNWLDSMIDKYNKKLYEGFFYGYHRINSK